MPSHYDGKYGKVASAMKRKKAMNLFGPAGGRNSGFREARDFEAGGGSQRVPPNVGVPPYKHGDSTSGTPQDSKAKAARPVSMKMKPPSRGQREANSPTQGEPSGPRSPMPDYQDGGKNPVKREAMKAASGFRSFQSIIRGNVMGMRPPKKLAKNMQPVMGKKGSY